MNKRDPKLYRELSEPFESVDLANTAITAFFEAVQSARKEFRLRDVSVIVEVGVDHEDGEYPAMANCHFGNQLNKLPIAARYYGESREEQTGIIKSAVLLGVRHQRARGEDDE